MGLNTYGLIVADPPWQFRVWDKDTGQGRSAESHYCTMTTPGIEALGRHLTPLLDNDAVLLLWSTWPHLEDALSVGRCWGFTYKTCAFDWVKRSTTGKHWHYGMGYYTRANSEPCLLFTRGKGLPRESKGVFQVIEETDQMPMFQTEPLVARVGRHSAKPNLFYERVEQLFGDVARLELFGRYPRAGWHVMGNEIDGGNISETLQAHQLTT